MEIIEKQPLVSIITAVYNRVSTLEETIISVIEQSYKNIEYIIIDGGSNDGTVEIIKKYEKKIKYWISQKDKGIYDAWNKGLSVAQGEWICFIGSDDVFLKDAITNYSTIFLKNNDLEYISSQVLITDYYLNPKKKIGEQWNWNTFKRRMNVAHVGSLHSKKLFLKYGNYDINYKIVGDYELLLRAKSLLKAQYIPIITAKMRDDGASVSINAVTEAAKAKILTGGANPFYTTIRSKIRIIKYSITNKIKRIF